VASTEKLNSPDMKRFVSVIVRLLLGNECRKQVDERLKALATGFPVAGIIVIEKIEIVIAKIEVAAILSSAS